MAIVPPSFIATYVQNQLIMKEAVKNNSQTTYIDVNLISLGTGPVVYKIGQELKLFVHSARQHIGDLLTTE